MYRLDYSCCIYGKNFDPTPFLQLAGINIISYKYVGDVGDTGRYKGKPYPYASIDFSSLDDDFDAFIQRLHTFKNLLTECDAEEKKIDIARYYTTQCNMEFNSNTLSLIGDLGLDLTISCYAED